MKQNRTEKGDQQKLNKEEMHALLYEALETELGGVQVYETALRCVLNKDLKKEWEEYLDQTKNHVNVMLNVFKALGLDPGLDTPGRLVVRNVGLSLIKTMEMALYAGKPQAAQCVASECVVSAETKDHMNWQLIGLLMENVKGSEYEALRRAYEEVEDEEDEHLYHSKGWARELHIEALGLDAELPPAEEKKDVKSALSAAQVQKDRKEALRIGEQKEQSQNETNHDPQETDGQTSQGIETSQNLPAAETIKS